MRRLMFLCALLPVAVVAQQNGQSGSILYPYKKPMPPASVVEADTGAIPTDGTAMGKKLQKKQQRQNSGPTWMYREPGEGKPTFITGPDGTRVCTDASGKVTVCW